MQLTEQTAGQQAGVIYGNASATQFTFAVTDPRVRRLDYIATTAPDGTLVLGQIMQLKRESSLSFNEAMSLGDTDDYEVDEKVSAEVTVIGHRDERDLLQVPRIPFRAGTPVSFAPEQLIQSVLGLETSDSQGTYLGMLKGTRLPVNLHINTLVQKHVSVLAKTGAGKSYCTGVLLEELLKKNVAIVIIDAHDEYHSLASPNIADAEIDRLLGFGLKPKGFASQMDLWTTEMNHRTDTQLLKLEGTGLQPSEITDLLGGRLSGAQQGILYQAIKDARLKNPLYTLRDIIDQAGANKSNSKWNVISALEALDSTGFFADDGVDPAKLVSPGRASIISLKGVTPDIQEVIVARLCTLLFEARKSQEVPPFLLVVEEAHNYCPERGIGNAVSLGILRTVASEGRKFGMGLCVVSQRPAKIDKNVLSQCNTQIILKVTNPNDLKAIVGSVEGLTSESADEIARLPVGVALVAGGSLGMPVMVEVRTRQSRHGGAGVDVIAGQKTEPVPRMKKELVYQSRTDLPQPGEMSKEPSKPKKEEKARVKPQEGGGISERRIQWGAKNESAEAPSPPPAPTPRPAPAPQPTIVKEVAPKELQRDPPPTPAPAPVQQAPPTPPTPMEPRDVRVHRVANRVGYVATLRAEETLDLLRKAASRTGTNANTYIDVFSKVGRTHCHREDPECTACPMAAKCAFKAKRDAKGNGNGDGNHKNVLSRFFGRK